MWLCGCTSAVCGSSWSLLRDFDVCMLHGIGAGLGFRSHGFLRHIRLTENHRYLLVWLGFTWRARNSNSINDVNWTGCNKSDFIAYGRGPWSGELVTLWQRVSCFPTIGRFSSCQGHLGVQFFEKDFSLLIFVNWKLVLVSGAEGAQAVGVSGATLLTCRTWGSCHVGTGTLQIQGFKP